MHAWSSAILDPLWRSAVGVVPLALAVAVICRYLPHRPAARHALWFMVLLALVVLPLLPGLAGTTRDVAPEPQAAPSSSHAAPAGPTAAPSWVMESPLVVECPSEAPAVVDAAPWDAVELATSAPSSGDGLPPPPDVPDEQRFSGAPVDAHRVAESERVSPLRIITNLLRAAGTTSNGAPQAAEDAPAAPVAYTVATTTDATTVNPEAVAPAGIVEATTPSTSAPGSEVLQRWRAWVAQLAAVRDAVGHVSPIPISLWIAGAVALGLFRMAAAGLLWHRLRAGWPAPSEVRRVVAVAARGLGLRRAPRCLMIRGRLSPMIWCGWRKRLVLPVELWTELDDAGRRAVVTHELAHLRRRDHWVRWLDLILGCVYWWHPLVWWVRARVQAEAEFCCDAWVTWVMPGERRAYAGALLTAHAFVSSDLGSVPAVGIGAGTRNAKSFARRLTMIMTRKDAPGLSATGWVFAGALILTGWAATPARSQPAPAVTLVREAPEERTITMTAPAMVVASVGEAAPVPAEQLTIAVAPSAAADPVEARIERLEKQMAEIAALLRGPSHSVPGVGSAATSAPAARWTPRAGSPGTPAPAPPAPPGPFAYAVPSQPGTPFVVRQAKVYSQEYRLPEGRLAALAQLMSREDVPVVVHAEGDAITLQGNAQQHAAFKRFVELISDEETRTYAVPAGKLEALAELMVRQDVAVRVVRGEGQIQVQGTPAQQQIFEDFLHLINGEQGSAAPRSAEQAYGLDPHAHAYLQAEQEAAARLRGLAQLHEETRAGRKAAVHDEAVQAHARALAEQHATMQRDAERLREEADRMREQADRLREQVDRMGEQIEQEAEKHSNAADVRAAEVDAAMAVLEAQIEAVVAQADARSQQADALTEQAAVLADHAGAVQAQAESLAQPCPEAPAPAELEAH